MTTRQQLAKIRAVLGPEAVESAKLFLPDKARETEAERMIRERQEAERTQRFIALRETRDAVLNGIYGAEAKKKAKALVAEVGLNSIKVLKLCAKLANDVRKSAHYRHLSQARKAAP